MNSFSPWKKFSPLYSPKDGEGGEEGVEEGAEKPDGKGKAGDQEALNKQFAERAQRASEAERKKLFEALGVKDEKEFEAYLKSKKEADDKNKSETERLAAEAETANKKLQELQATSQAEKDALNKRVVDSEIKFAALAPVKDKDGKITRVAFLPNAMDEVILLIDRSEIKDAEGKLDGVEKALEKLAKAKPHLLADQNTVKPHGTPRGGTDRTRKTVEEGRTPIINSL